MALPTLPTMATTFDVGTSTTVSGCAGLHPDIVFRIAHPRRTR
ncbi:hypothetical protein [Aeromicrobium sp. UC242_57]